MGQEVASPIEENSAECFLSLPFYAGRTERPVINDLTKERMYSFSILMSPIYLDTNLCQPSLLGNMGIKQNIYSFEIYN